MAEIFDIYTQHIRERMSSISTDLNSLKSASADHCKANQMLLQLEANIRECEKLLKTLLIEQVTGSNGSNSHLCVMNYQTGISQYRRRFNQEKERIEEERKRAILFNETVEANENSAKANGDGYAIAYRSFENLEKAKRETIAIEIKGNEIMNEMACQTDQMKSIGGKVTTMNGNLSMSSSLVNEMELHHHKNKKLVFLLAIALLTVFLGIVALRLISSKSNYPQEPSSLSIPPNTTLTSSTPH